MLGSESSSSSSSELVALQSLAGAAVAPTFDPVEFHRFLHNKGFFALRPESEVRIKEKAPYGGDYLIQGIDAYTRKGVQVVLFFVVVIFVFEKVRSDWPVSATQQEPSAAPDKVEYSYQNRFLPRLGAVWLLYAGLAWIVSMLLSAVYRNYRDHSPHNRVLLEAENLTNNYQRLLQECFNLRAVSAEQHTAILQYYIDHGDVKTVHAILLALGEEEQDGVLNLRLQKILCKPNVASAVLKELLEAALPDIKEVWRGQKQQANNFLTECGDDLVTLMQGNDEINSMAFRQLTAIDQVSLVYCLLSAESKIGVAITLSLLYDDRWSLKSRGVSVGVTGHHKVAEDIQTITTLNGFLKKFVDSFLGLVPDPIMANMMLYITGIENSLARKKLLKIFTARAEIAAEVLLCLTRYAISRNDVTDNRPIVQARALLKAVTGFQELADIIEHIKMVPGGWQCATLLLTGGHDEGAVKIVQQLFSQESVNFSAGQASLFFKFANTLLEKAVSNAKFIFEQVSKKTQIEREIREGNQKLTKKEAVKKNAPKDEVLNDQIDALSEEVNQLKRDLNALPSVFPAQQENIQLLQKVVPIIRFGIEKVGLTDSKLFTALLENMANYCVFAYMPPDFKTMFWEAVQVLFNVKFDSATLVQIGTLLRRAFKHDTGESYQHFIAQLRQGLGEEIANKMVLLLIYSHYAKYTEMTQGARRLTAVFSSRDRPKEAIEAFHELLSCIEIDSHHVIEDSGKNFLRNVWNSLGFPEDSLTSILQMIGSDNAASLRSPNAPK